MIVMRNNDRPGVIGHVGTVLGRHGINVASFALGRERRSRNRPRHRGRTGRRSTARCWTKSGSWTRFARRESSGSEAEVDGSRGPLRAARVRRSRAPSLSRSTSANDSPTVDDTVAGRRRLALAGQLHAGRPLMMAVRFSDAVHDVDGNAGEAQRERRRRRRRAAAGATTGAGAAARRGTGRAPNWNGLRDGAAPACAARRGAASRRRACSSSAAIAAGVGAGGRGDRGLAARSGRLQRRRAPAIRPARSRRSRPGSTSSSRSSAKRAPSLAFPLSRFSDRAASLG